MYENPETLEHAQREGLTTQDVGLWLKDGCLIDTSRLYIDSWWLMMRADGTYDLRIRNLSNSIHIYENVPHFKEYINAHLKEYINAHISNV